MMSSGVTRCAPELTNTKGRGFPALLRYVIRALAALISTARRIGGFPNPRKGKAHIYKVWPDAAHLASSCLGRPYLRIAPQHRLLDRVQPINRSHRIVVAPKPVPYPQGRGRAPRQAGLRKPSAQGLWQGVIALHRRNLPTPTFQFAAQIERRGGLTLFMCGISHV